MSAAAVAAGAMAVESQNVVGVQDFGGTARTLISAAPTLTPIGDSGSGMVLGDITVNSSFESGSDSIRLYAANGYVSGEYSYLTADLADELEVPEGWYTMDDFGEENFSSETCQNSVPLPFGTGLVFAPANSGANLKFVGEVKNAATSVAPTARTLCRTGNSSPIDIHLGDITVNSSFESGSDSIRLYAANGDVSGEYSYLTADLADELEVPEGWYTMDDFGEENFSSETCQNSILMPAGAGFVFAPANSGAAIIVPNPLAE